MAVQKLDIGQAVKNIYQHYRGILLKYSFYLKQFKIHISIYRPRSIEAISNPIVAQHQTTLTKSATLQNGRKLNGCITRGSGGLHEDLEFPPNVKTLSRRKLIVWMRPHVRI